MTTRHRMDRLENHMGGSLINTIEKFCCEPSFYYQNGVFEEPILDFTTSNRPESCPIDEDDREDHSAECLRCKLVPEVNKHIMRVDSMVEYKPTLKSCFMSILLDKDGRIVGMTGDCPKKLKLDDDFKQCSDCDREKHHLFMKYLNKTYLDL